MSGGAQAGACRTRFGLLLACALLAAGCSGIQSTLAPSGREATRIAGLFWWMAGGAVIVWIGVVALAIYYARHATGTRDRRRDRLLIVGGGVVLPGVTLTILLIFGLAMLPGAVERAPEGSLQVAVTGEQWWWRVRYDTGDGQEVVLANEIRLPLGEPVQFRLDSDNVIHSFWIPSLAGKMDMIPGRVTYLTVRPTATGIFRGVCAEYCGTSHALMAFYVEVMEKAAFDRWLAHQATPAMSAAAEGPARRGGELFGETGCTACHTVRGTRAAGTIGPDLTHVGSRLSVAAGILPTDVAHFQRWIARSEDIKPGVHMPAFDMLPAADLQALAAYLHGLK
jgi:cytochrome c oxidase subunit 2